MKQAELILLDMGNYKLTDGICHYSLVKKLDHDNDLVYQIKEISERSVLTLFPKGDNEMSGTMHVGNIFIHSRDVEFAIRDLKLVND